MQEDKKNIQPKVERFYVDDQSCAYDIEHITSGTPTLPYFGCFLFGKMVL